MIRRNGYLVSTLKLSLKGEEKSLTCRDVVIFHAIMLDITYSKNIFVRLVSNILCFQDEASISELPFYRIPIQNYWGILYIGYDLKILDIKHSNRHNKRISDINLAVIIK